MKMQLMCSLVPLVERVLLRRRGLKIQLALLSRDFLCLMKALPWGRWQDGGNLQPCCKTAPAGFPVLWFCPLLAALLQRWFQHLTASTAPVICLSSCIMLCQFALETCLLLHVQDDCKSFSPVSQ